MKLEKIAALVLAVGLCLLSWFGNLPNLMQHHISVFPWGVDILVFPLVLIPALWSLRKKERASTRNALQQAGWAIVWRAGLPFALFVTVLGAAAFTPGEIILLLTTFAGTLILAIVMGWGWAYACAWALGRKGVPA
jgi:amino acid permease